MTYKKKVAVLSALAAALALAYILSFALDPENRRASAFAWLDASASGMADRIEIYGVSGNSELIRRNDVWFSQGQSGDYPVKQGRVEDLFAALTRKDAYTHAASSEEARERLSLTEDSASRIIVHGGAARVPLLDLMIGRAAALGSGIYMRKAGLGDIYSGEDRFTYFTDASPSSWYDLRLFASGGPDSIEAVQQADVRLPDTLIEGEALEDGGFAEGTVTAGEAYTLRRRGGGWVIVGNEGAALESTKVDSWLRTLLEAEADGFADSVGGAGAGAAITLWLGDGTSRTVGAGAADGEGRRVVQVSGAQYGFTLSGWTFNLLWRGSGSFMGE